MNDHATTQTPVVTLTDANFDGLVLDSDKPILVDFWAPWCGPCRTIAPQLEQLAAELDGQLIIGKYNTQDEGQVAGAMGIRSIPTLVLFKDGDVADVMVGAGSYARLEKWARRAIEPKRSLMDRLKGRSKA